MTRPAKIKLHRDTPETECKKAELILKIARAEYKRIPAKLKDLFLDVSELYAGEWPAYQNCQVGYHTFGHAMDVSLATARMVAGWNRGGGDPPITKDIFLLAMAAALFHDAGYIKDTGDTNGKGGKFTLTHVARSITIAIEYLTAKKWPDPAIESISTIISITDFLKHTYPDAITNPEPGDHTSVVARMVASSDIVAQMADVDYFRNIHKLYEEFEELYQTTPRELFAAQGSTVFNSAQEMIDGTHGFYDYFVLPRLEQLGEMGQYLVGFFGNGRNPYFENIAANLADRPTSARIQWRHPSEIVKDIRTGPANKADQRPSQRKITRQEARNKKHSAGLLVQKVLGWLELHLSGKSPATPSLLGADSKILSENLLNKLLPPGQLENLNQRELLYLLRILVLQQNIHQGPWIFTQSMELIAEMFRCEASSILLANPIAQKMVITFPSGPKKESIQGRTIPIDKGLAGWVYLHGLPSMVSDVYTDERFHGEMDKQVDFQTRSILAVPLLIEGECIGVMEALNKTDGVAFNHHDMHIMTLLANLITNSLLGILWLLEKE